MYAVCVEYASPTVRFLSEMRMRFRYAKVDARRLCRHEMIFMQNAAMPRFALLSWGPSVCVVVVVAAVVVDVVRNKGEAAVYLENVLT